MNYFEYIPYDLIKVINEYLNNYDTVINFAKILQNFIDNYTLDNIFLDVFSREYPLIYKDILEVINDDIYLNNNLEKLSRYVVLYAIFKEYYSEVIYLPNYQKSVSELLSLDNLEKISTLDANFSLYILSDIEHPDIVYRAAFKNKDEDLYKRIIKLESFDMESLKKYRDKNKTRYMLSKYWYYGLNWRTLYDMLIGSTEFLYDGLSGEAGDLYVSLHLLQQDNPLDILRELISNEDIKDFIKNRTGLQEVLNMIGGNEKERGLFKFIYSNHIDPTEDESWAYLIESIKNDNYDMFIWLLENEEATWLDNEEFYEEYDILRIKNKNINYDKYDYILDKYKIYYM